MSKWTDVQDGLVSVMDVKEVSETVKAQMTAILVNDGVPAIETVADKFVAQIQEQAANETGWNAVRDKFVLPLLINGTLWLTKLVLNKSTAPQQQL